MNRLKGKVVAVESNLHMSLVDVQVGGDVLSATLLEAPGAAGYLEIGCDVTMLFKETEVSLGKGMSGLISLSNRLACSVRGIERGDILSAVELDYAGRPLVCVVTTRSVERLQLAAGDTVEALVKANAIALMEGHHDA